MTSKIRVGSAVALIVALIMVIQIQFWWFAGSKPPAGALGWASAGLLAVALVGAAFFLGTWAVWRAPLGLIATLAMVGECVAWAPFPALDSEHRRWIAFGAGALAVVAGWVAGALAERRVRRVEARARDEAAEASAALAAARAQVASDRYAAVEALFQTALVEVVASAQALVRNAYPDDTLSRMRSAEDAIHEALGDLERILLAPADVTEPSVPGESSEPARPNGATQSSDPTRLSDATTRSAGSSDDMGPRAGRVPAPRPSGSSTPDDSAGLPSELIRR